MTMLLTACVPENSDAVKIVCPEIRKYDQTMLNRALSEYQALPKGSAIRTMIGDYKQLRDQIRICKEQG